MTIHDFLFGFILRKSDFLHDFSKDFKRNFTKDMETLGSLIVKYL